jgi:phenylalanyl-tRNA synthetase beta chain
MRISLKWLQTEFLAGSLTAQQAAEALTHGGLPVEHIETRGDDTIIDVEVTSNRGDCLSHLGVARELCALLNIPRRPGPPLFSPEGDGQAPTRISIEAPKLCPQYTARIIRGVKIGPSPRWLVERLEALAKTEGEAGVRSINNVVDVTNYVMMELGQPLHAFDLDRLAGAGERIIIREARAGEKIISIDGHERTLGPGMLAIADAHRPIAVAGVMGGRDSEVTDTTANVLLESARFDALCVRRTARALGMHSESSYRFERQVDPALASRASLRATQLILEVAGGEVVGPLVSAGEPPPPPRKLVLRLARLKQVLGVELPPGEVVDALARLQLEPVVRDDRVEVVIPSWRLDLNIEVDLVEEVARIVGYERIPMREEISIRVVPPGEEARTIDVIRQALVGAGYFEAISVSFVSDPLLRDFAPPEAGSFLRADPAVRRDNAHLRPSIIPSLLEAVRRNETTGTPGAWLFEIGSTFWLAEGGKVDERQRIGLVGSAELREVRGSIEALLEKLNPDRAVKVVPEDRPGYARGACGRVEWGGRVVGHLGRVGREIAEKLSLRDLPAAAELELAPLLELAQPVRLLHPLPRFPAIQRDLSLVVAESVRFAQIEQALGGLDLPNLEGLEYITTYRGKPLEQGTKSVTVTLIFRSPSTTLTSEQVEDSVQRAIEAARQQLGATLRG